VNKSKNFVGKTKILAKFVRQSLIRHRSAVGDTCPSIHEIFELFVEKDYSEKQIAGYLNNKGIPSPGGVSWSSGTIHRMLTDEQYAGAVVYNKTSGIFGEKSKCKPNPRDEWIITQGSYTTIINPELFQKAQDKILARRRQFSTEEIQQILKSVFDKYGLLSLVTQR